MNDTVLYNLTTKGEIEEVCIWTDNAVMWKEWGLICGKKQVTSKVCKGKNKGKKNETSPSQQAEKDAEIEIRKRIEKGFTYEIPVKGTKIVNSEIDLHNMPKQFCPSKPTSDMPDSIFKNPQSYGQRKYNGNCLIFIKTKENKVYTRRMKDITESIENLPIIKQLFSKMNDGQMLNTEFYFMKNDRIESTKGVGSICKTKDSDDVIAKYNEALPLGKFHIAIFDIIFDNYKFVGNSDYVNRHKILVKQFTTDSNNSFFTPELYFDWKNRLDTAKENGWEGFVVRIPGEKSYIKYSLNGKPERAGAWKYKFTKEDDFIVTEVELGKSGKHADVYTRFHLAQIDSDKNEIDCGWAGQGNLTMEELEELTADINNKKTKLPFAVQVEFRDWQEDSNSLEHPVIKRIRFDKPINECIFEEK